jgi:hypothetical protein
MPLKDVAMIQTTLRFRPNDAQKPGRFRRLPSKNTGCLEKPLLSASFLRRQKALFNSDAGQPSAVTLQ